MAPLWRPLIPRTGSCSSSCHLGLRFQWAQESWSELLGSKGEKSNTFHLCLAEELVKAKDGKQDRAATLCWLGVGCAPCRGTLDPAGGRPSLFLWFRLWTHRAMSRDRTVLDRLSSVPPRLCS